MTTSRGSMGVLWGRYIVTLYVKASRHTHKFLEASEGFTCSFLVPEMKDTLLRCGQHNGRDSDKVATTGLIPEYIPTGIGAECVTFRQASLILSCTKVSVMQVDASQFVIHELVNRYKDGDFHTVYIGFIDKILAKQ